MARLTISLSEDRHRALRETAARTGKSIGLIIDESLELAGIKTREAALAIVAQARQSAALSESEAVRVALREVRSVRRMNAAK